MSRVFYQELIALSSRLGVSPHDLLAVIYLESRVEHAAMNPTSGASGLIQFLPSSLKAVGYGGPASLFRELFAHQQLPYVETYLQKVKASYGRLDPIDRLYRAILLPGSLAFGDTGETVIASEDRLPQVFYANKGLDLDNDGAITLADIRQKLEDIRNSPRYQQLLGEMCFSYSPWPPDLVAESAMRGLDCSRSVDQERYLSVLAGPGDQDAQMRRYFLSGPSTCALFARGVWRNAGVEHDILNKRYVIGHAVADVMKIAMEKTAWISRPAVLEKGDVFLIVSPEHVGVVISEPQKVGNGWVCDTAEGGQSPDGSYIRRFTRRFEERSGRLWLGQRHVVGRAPACLMLPSKSSKIDDPFVPLQIPEQEKKRS